MDTPTCATGFATVAKNILKMLVDTGKYDIDILGINYDGAYYDREKYPYKIYPAYSALIPDSAYHDLYGRQAFLDMLGTGNYELVFIIQDTFIIETLAPLIVQTYEKLPPERKFKFIYYYPIDATPKKSWIEGSVLLADFPVAYTKYAYDESLHIYPIDKKGELTDAEKLEMDTKFKILQAKLNVIYHGVNTKQFYPMELKKEKQIEMKKKYFGENNPNKFIFMNLNRNQPRKDMFRSLQACKILLDRRRKKGKDDVWFYFHCQHSDSSGLNLIEMSKQIGFVQGTEFGFPNPYMFSASKGFSIEMVNELYNTVDCVFSTTLGEGFGLSLVEAMATKKILVFPDNTAIKEIVGNNERGILFKSGDTPNNLAVLANDNDRIRPVSNVIDLVDKMEWVMENQGKVKTIVDRAYAWVKELDWTGELVGKKWKLLFEKASEIVFKERDELMAESKVDWKKLTRNDRCPICKIKVKRCRHSELI